MELLHSEDEVHDQPALYDAVVRAADWVSLLPSQRSTLSVQAVLSIDRAARNGRARPGDWVCNSCGALNFQSRDECFKCDAPKAGLADKQVLLPTRFYDVRFFIIGVLGNRAC
eukprot:1171077-Pleurochrysis_carterae.AAC.2